ncbi:MAG: RNase H family protein, partial [Clostridia bacterium]
MEIMAVIEALRCIRMPCQCTIHSDSAYVVNAFNEGWLTKWEASSWKTADKKEVKNIDLWQKLLLEVKKHIVTFVKVKGHNNDHYNEICDTLAKKGVSELT